MIYLDNAATTFPKPSAVCDGVFRFLVRDGGNPGRGSHALSARAADCVFSCREELASLFGVSDLERVFFTMNTTQGINTVLKGLLREGDHVLISDMEHNAVLRPITKLCNEGRITYDVFPTLVGSPKRDATHICAGIARLIRPNTRLVVLAHSSNICSATLPLREIGHFCARHGILLVVDGAQSAGHKEISVDEMQITALCIPGHKGLYGPQGCGAVLLGKDVFLDTLFEGGNGLLSLSGEMPPDAPERYEAGTLPTPAIAGLLEGVRAVKKMGIDEIDAHHRHLFCLLRDRLSSLPELTLHASEYEGPVLLFHHARIPSEALTRILDSKGLCLRGGFHCSALGHKTLGTPEGGAVRASFGIYNNSRDVDALWRTLRDLEQ